MFTDYCNICYNSYEYTVKISEQCEQGVTWLTKLQYIAPEIEWTDDHLICSLCVHELEAAYKFREKCLQIKNLQEVTKYDVEFSNFEDAGNSHFIDESTAEEKPEVIDCSYCGEHFSAKAELNLHLKEKHNIIENRTSKTIKYKRKEECLKCGRRFALVASLQDHESSCDGIIRHRKVTNDYQCDNCKKYYATFKILALHQKRCNSQVVKKTEYQCTQCNSYYVSAKTLKEHKKRGCKKDDGIDQFTCTICSKDFNSSRILKKHIFEIHKLKQCDLCGISFESYEEYESHMREEHIKVNPRKSKRFICEVCHEPFSLLKDFVVHCTQLHMLDEKVLKPYLCDICNNRFRSSTNLMTHRLYHDGNRVNVCSYCGNSFITKNDLRAHEQTHFNKRNYKCNNCEKAFKTNTNLRTHNLIVHTDPALWKYVCHICNKRFPQKSNFDQHVKRHTGEKDFVCPLCKKAFTSKRELQEHTKLHSNERAYKCEHCSKAYRKRYTYRVHLTKVHGNGNAKVTERERKYACHICPGRFHDKLKLTRHLSTHSGIKPFLCSMCDKKFSDKSYLKQHLKVSHNVAEDLLLC